jgi:predicted alpha/beta-fold hydrolase
MKFMGDTFFGVYDYILGMYLTRIAVSTIKEIDRMNAKTYPERVIGDDDVDSVYTLNQFCEKIVVKIEGFKNL